MCGVCSDTFEYWNPLIRGHNNKITFDGGFQLVISIRVWDLSLLLSLSSSVYMVWFGKNGGTSHHAYKQTNNERRPNDGTWKKIPCRGFIFQLILVLAQTVFNTSHFNLKVSWQIHTCPSDERKKRHTHVKILYNAIEVMQAKILRMTEKMAQKDWVYRFDYNDFLLALYVCWSRNVLFYAGIAGCQSIWAYSF